jgi:hypothetical protein
VPASLAAYLVLLTSAAVLVLEVLVSRLVAPYVGLTLETYTAAIGAALAAIAAGSALGGRLADVHDPRRWLGVATAVGGALVLAARPTVFAFGGGFRGTGPIGTLVLVGLAVAPAALVLSLVPPGVVKLRLRTWPRRSRPVGRRRAVGTLGALAGHLPAPASSAGPRCRPRQRCWSPAALLVVSGRGRSGRREPRGQHAGRTLVGALSQAAGWCADGTCQYETRYYCATVERPRARAAGQLVLDGLRHSYVDLDDASTWSSLHASASPTCWRAGGRELDVLHLGLGGGSPAPPGCGAPRLAQHRAGGRPAAAGHRPGRARAWPRCRT